MKITQRSIILSAMIMLGLGGCGTSATSTNSLSENTDETIASPTSVAGVTVTAIDVSLANYEVLKIDGDKKLQIDLGSEKKDVYALFSNTDNVVHSATVTHNQKTVGTIYTSKSEFIPNIPTYNIENTPKSIQEFNNQELSLSDKDNKTGDVNLKKVFKTVADSEGATQIFYTDAESTTTSVAATARKVLTNINTSFGSKSLTIWVEDAAYGSGCSKAQCVDDIMVESLANKFLKEGSDNDIYDWVTTVFGEEWGTSSYTTLIEPSNHISILLTDISQDNRTNGGVIGYFHSKDNFKKDQYIGSNERIMFYIDSVMYANGTDGWNEDGFWQQQVFSTLAHEFQHMIYFYQKNITRDLQDTDTWLNEMLSESTEDLVSVKMNVNGPRNVVFSRGDAGDINNHNGRYPLFNENNTLILSSWDNTLSDYSKVSSFGAYLLRNYGGAELLHNIVHNTLLNEDALMYAVHKHPNGSSKTFDDLIHDWGVAVLLSKRDDVSSDSGYLYNAGDFIVSAYNGINYNLGSINFFNYNPAPVINRTMGQVAPKSNYYYTVGEGLSGDIELDISDTSGLNVSLVIVK